jgi:phosphoglucosamine mutase
MGRLFGTDGIRAPADARLVDLARRVGGAVARACLRGPLGSVPNPRVLVGRDTRVSGARLEQSLIDGVVAAGGEAVRAGIVPTAAVAYLTASLPAEAGVMISASHNPPGDNGMKVIGPGGWKLDPQTEDGIESLIAGSSEESSAEPGTVVELTDALDTYMNHLVGCVSSDLKGMRVVVDCAEGAASSVAPLVLERLGAEVVAINASGDGARINEGSGATHPEVIADAARSEGVIGLTFDGDADRVLVADESGTIVDGDGIMALIASHLRKDGRLAGDAIVGTVMSNQSLRRWCVAEGIRFVETPVGDRHVLEAMQKHGLVLGGEQAGHIVRLDQSTTGDGILIGLDVLDIVRSSGKPLSELVPFRPMPQVLVNVKTNGVNKLDAAGGVHSAIAQAERRLGDDGRVLVRPSGTEPLVRVMVEAKDRELAGELAELVATAVRDELNGAG